MRVLVINRVPLSANRYLEWLGPHCSTYLITAASALSSEPADRERELAGYEGTLVLDDYDGSPLVEAEAHRLHRDRPFDLVVALSEFDVLRAARLRDALGIPGQSEDSALAFRDKLRMKQLLAERGIPVAGFRAIPHASALLSFAAEHGYPFVVKPRREAGSVGVAVLRSPADLLRCLADHPALGGDRDADLMAETLVEHELIHVDGIVHDHVPLVIWPSSHGGTSALGFHDGAALHSRMLDGADPVARDSVELVTAALAALPTPGTTLFHAEVFRTSDGRLLLNEIASRVGGGKIHRTLRAAFGFPLIPTYLRLETGLLSPGEVSGSPQRLAGWLHVPPTAGTVEHMPQSCPFPGIEEYRTHAGDGDELRPASTSVDAVMSAVVCADTEAEVQRLLGEVERWFAATAVIAERDEETA